MDYEIKESKQESLEMLSLFDKLIGMKNDAYARILALLPASSKARVESIDAVNIKVTNDDSELEECDIFLEMELEAFISNIDTQDIIALSHTGKATITTCNDNVICASYATSYNFSFNEDDTVTSSLSMVS